MEGQICIETIQYLLRYDLIRQEFSSLKQLPTPENLDLFNKMDLDLYLVFIGQRPQSAEAEAKEGEKKEKEEKKLVRARYLMEKYATRWQQRMLKLPTVHLRLVQSTWLQQAMFSRSSLSARQTATKIIEDIAQVPARKKEIIDMLTGYVNAGYYLQYRARLFKTNNVIS